MSTANHAKLLIIGSGPAGYTAAVYAARALLEPVLIAGMEPGGQLTITTEVENYPGFAEPIQGPWLMEQMRSQAENVGTRIVSDIVVSAELTTRPFRLTLDSGDVWTADAVVIATGAQARWLGLPSEERFKGFGVSACATCDGFFYKDKDVLVVGGGNTAVEEALYLSHLARHVTLVHRRDALRAERILQDRLLTRDNVSVMWDCAIEEVLGQGGFPPSVTGAKLRNVRTGAISEVAVDGVFIAIGHAPAVSLFKDQLRLKPNGYLWTAPDSTATDIPGVFAAGDVTDDVFRQAVTAAGQGCMAALEAEKYLFALEAQQEAAE
ncbi:thioredoxin-disulfide reductase [Afifella marina]|nr:thioredoxin-disulfide reductase [Afifella marina]MBK1624254.1 thioredoxin-disulfide reductase [Afifella marina DSM 2698]MBK1627987.1 thioredoxin-disulfide reductase [Afifella marina]MBK5918181.1 thioredoxin-disulfide reductase [Afifella marina]RAI19326.1 thioredoxin-disulfide reductase [Afifella marina DSM 2698]